jgi:hypothetical protein
MIRPLHLVAVVATVGILIPGMFAAPRPSQAMPEFAEATGLKCSACHTVVPLLNAFGRYVQNSAYSILDRHALAKTFPVWLDEATNYDSTAGAGTGTARLDFGNFALHGIGYIAPDITYHAQQWIVQSGESGGLDTLWVAYDHLGSPYTHLFVGKIENLAPSPYSQTSDLDGPLASSTVVGEHDWGATNDNRWGAKVNYVANSLDLEAGDLLSSDDLNGITDFNPGDKTFQWKAAYARPKSPVEVGVFGSLGTVPVSTGTDKYNSEAGYVEVDPAPNGRPGLLAIYQSEYDSNPGADPNGLQYPAVNTRGFSAEVFESTFRGNLLLSYRHDFNDAAATGGTSNGNSINAAFNLPGSPYLHGYLEANLGGNSTLYGLSGGPEWKGMLWLTVPLTPVRH